MSCLLLLLGVLFSLAHYSVCPWMVFFCSCTICSNVTTEQFYYIFISLFFFSPIQQFDERVLRMFVNQMQKIPVIGGHFFYPWHSNLDRQSHKGDIVLVLAACGGAGIHQCLRKLKTESGGRKYPPTVIPNLKSLFSFNIKGSWTRLDCGGYTDVCYCSSGFAAIQLLCCLIYLFIPFVCPLPIWTSMSSFHPPPVCGKWLAGLIENLNLKTFPLGTDPWCREVVCGRASFLSWAAE